MRASLARSPAQLTLLYRWAHKQGSMQTGIVSRLLESHSDSVPLLLLRGHAQLLSGKFPAALRQYFKVHCFLCNLHSSYYDVYLGLVTGLAAEAGIRACTHSAHNIPVCLLILTR